MTLLKNAKTLAKTVVVISAVFSMVGCATMFGNKNRTVTIDSKPVGAKIYLNGNLVGTTPTKVTVAKSSDNVLTLRKPGYYVGESAVPARFQKVGILNIFFWPGFLIDYATGDMHSVDKNVSVVLRKK